MISRPGDYSVPGVWRQFCAVISKTIHLAPNGIRVDTENVLVYDLGMRLYSIRLYLEPNPGGIYTITSPDVPGLVTEGRTPAEIQQNVQEALAALIEVWRELGKETPPALRPALTDRPQTVEMLVAA